jgi:hypothetical protein
MTLEENFVAPWSKTGHPLEVLVALWQAQSWPLNNI